MMAKSVEQIKVEANAAFKSNKFMEAEQLYTSAIELAKQQMNTVQEEEKKEIGKTLAVLLGNRSNTSIKLEKYGLAINDANDALKYNSSYIKAYYRKGTACFALSNYKDAKKSYLILVKLLPNDKDAKFKLKECEKRIREIAFVKAIESEKVNQIKISENLNLDNFKVDESTYKGPKLITATSTKNNDDNDSSNDINNIDDIEITLDFIKELINCFKEQKLIHIKYALQIILKAKKIMETLPNIVTLDIKKNDKITVCGDVHGQYYDLVNCIFKQNNLPSSENPYIFNGDFVDRGSFSVEVILTLLAIKCYDPNSIHLIRGNHESLNMNKIYGFEGECISKYSDIFFKLFSEFFQTLPLAYILDGTVNNQQNGKKAFIVHGGLFSKDGVTIKDIMSLDRQQEPDSGLMAEMLWSDPQDQNGWGPSKRGIGVSFGPDVTERFLSLNNLDLVVRSHEMKEQGYEVSANGKLITIFSAPNYCDTMGNKGAYITFDHTMKPQFTQFSAVPHPNVQPMQYASKLLFGGGA